MCSSDLAPLLASRVFFANTVDDASGLANVQWTYLGVAGFVALLLILFFLAPFPEITDADMAFQAEETHTGADDKPFRKQYRLFHAAFAQFCYTGAQIAIASYFINYIHDTRPGTTDSMGAQLLAGAQGAFALGRFIGVAIMNFAKPRWVFLGYLTMYVMCLFRDLDLVTDTC